MKKYFLWILSLFATPVLAHPHAFIEMQSKPLVENRYLMGFSTTWLLDEPSSASLLYDLQLRPDDQTAYQALNDEMQKNIINEHYFSYFYDKQGNKIKYKSVPANFELKAVKQQVQYRFDFLLSHPQPLANNTWILQTYDPTYYVAMFYPTNKPAVDFSALPANCRGELKEPRVDDKTKNYAASLDRSQRDEDNTLGQHFAQKVVIQCQ